MEYSEFAGIYDNFMVPSMQIIIGDKKLTEELGCATSGVNVSLSMGEPSTASFQISDCYDPETRAVKSIIRNHIKLGSTVEVRIGYGTDQTMVFKGYIDSTSLSYSAENGFTYDVSAADVVKLLKDSGKRRREFKVKKYAEAFKELMGAYESLAKPETDDMEGELQTALLQEGTDYDFIMKDLIEDGDPDFEFYVFGGIAYYKKQKETQEVVTTFKPGAGLKGCNFSFQFLNRDVTVMGYSHDMQEYQDTQSAAAKNLDSAAVKGTEVVVIHAENLQQVKDKAKRYVKDLKKRSKNGSLTVIGLPELIPGTSVEISDVDGLVDGIYNIIGVKHSVGSSGYISELTIGG